MGYFGKENQIFRKKNWSESRNSEINKESANDSVHFDGQQTRVDKVNLTKILKDYFIW